MPHFRIETNVPKNKIPQDFVTKTVPILAKSLGKPEQYCVVSVVPDVLMSFAGTTEPCAIGNLMSIGALGVEQNKKHAKALFDVVEKELGVPKTRIKPLGKEWHVTSTDASPISTVSNAVCEMMYITFQDEPTGNVGYNGTTFHALFG